MAGDGCPKEVARNNPDSKLLPVIKNVKSVEVNKMEQEKDNFWVWIGAVIVAAVVGVVLLKARENEVSGWDNGSIQESKAEVNKQLSRTK